MDEQLELAHKVVNIVDRANRKICVTLLRYSVYKPESSYAHSRKLSRKKENEKFTKVFTWVLHLKNLSIYLM